VTSWCSTRTPSRADTRIDRALQCGVVECHEPAALVTDQVVVVLAAGEDPFKARQPGTHGHALHQPVLDQQLQHSVDACPAYPMSLGAKRILDFHRAERAGLPGQQVDDPFTRAATAKSSPGQDRVRVLRPGRNRVGVRGHQRQAYPL
jgi:hypothetical protein